MKTITITLILIFVLAGAVLAQQRFESLRAADFHSGFNGTQEQFNSLMEIIDEALLSNPNHPLAKVLHGVGMLRRAGEAAQKGEGESASKLFQSALDEMDEGVQLAPDTTSVRIPRGSVLITMSRFMPSPIARPILESGLSDFERVLALQEQDGTFLKRSAHQRGELLTGLADAWSRMGNADKSRAYFERIVTELSGTIYEQKARAWLENRPEVKSPQFFACSGCHVK